VLLPAWNAQATLEVCLRSLRRQTEPNWECILVDDGSTDETRAIADAMVRQDGRLRVVTTPHRGLVAALNEGLRHCRAPLVARMDADDVMHRERLARQAAALDADPALAAIGAHVRIFPRSRMAPRLREYEAWLNSLRSAGDVARDAFVECPIAHPTLMMRASMASLGYAGDDYPEDYDLILRAVARGLRIGVAPRRLLGWRDREDSLSRTDPRYGHDRFVACKAHHLARMFLRDRDDYILWGYGGTGRELRRALAALGKRPSHIVEVKPQRIGERIHGAPVIPPGALPPLRGIPIVVSVARAGPRAEIRAAMAQMGFEEGREYVCAA
jgi:glycosyltransferase involved in cell wall biosynthesis